MSSIKVGLISDTHGLLRPEAAAALQDCSIILHAGDIGEGVLEKLRRTADTVVAVKGNTDMWPWSKNLRLTEQVEIEGLKFFIVHNLAQFGAVPADVDVVVHGHTPLELRAGGWGLVHQPRQRRPSPL